MPAKSGSTHPSGGQGRPPAPGCYGITLQHLLNLKSSADPDQREQAARELRSFLPNAHAIDALIGLLGDSDWRVRRASVDSILTGDSQILTPQVLQSLYDEENAGRRNAAIDLLTRFGRKIVPHLGPHLNSGNPDVQMFLIQMLGDIHDRTYLEEIVSAVESKEDNVASAAILALGKIGEPGSLPLILRLLQSSDPWKQFQAIEAAGEMRDPGVLPALILLRNSPYCGKQILKTLGKFPDADAYRTLIRSLFEKGHLDPNALEALLNIYREFRPAIVKNELQAKIRREFREQTGSEELRILIRELEIAPLEQKDQILQLLGWSSSEEAVRILIQHLSDPELGETAVHALANVGSAAAKNLFERLHAKPATGEMVNILGLLIEMQTAVKPQDLEGLTKHASGEVRQLAYRLLVHSSDELPVELLTRGVLDSNLSVHEVCLRPLLSRCHDSEDLRKRLLDDMGKRLHSGSVSERSAALEILSSLERDASGPLLAQAFKDADPVVRRKTAGLMQSSYDVSFRRLLTTALADEDERVRELAVRALKHDPSEEVTGALLAAMQDESLWVRMAAYESIAAEPHGARSGAVILQQLQSENPAAGAVLLRSLASIPGVLSNALVLSYTQNKDPEIRKSACEALSPSSDPGLETALRSLAENDPDWKVRAAALQTILRVFPARATEILHARWESEQDPYVRRQILRSWREVQPDLPPSDLFSCLLDPHLADDAYEFLLSVKELLSGSLAKAALSQPPAIRRILQTILS